MTSRGQVGVWFPAIRAGTGADVFTQRLCDGLNARGIRAEITWLPRHAEYLPWILPAPKMPEWANVVHINTWLHPRLIPSGALVVATMHHVVHQDNAAAFTSLVQRLYHRLWIMPIEKRVLSIAAAVTAVSQFTAGRVRLVFGIKDVEVIPNWVDTGVFSPSKEPEQHEPFRLLYVGSWSRRKGVDLLSPIMRRLGSDFELRFTHRDPCASQKNGLPDNCVCLGQPNTKELVEAMRACDLLIFPSRLEGFGLVAAESMACGLPVVATRGSSLPEVVEDGVTGTLCPQDDIGAFVDAIQRLKDNPLLLSEMSTNAVSLVRERFSVGAALDSYYKIYLSVTCKRGAIGS